jgi:hypothetical protein
MKSGSEFARPKPNSTTDIRRCAADPYSCRAINQKREVRATFYTVSSLVIIIMPFYVLTVAVF